MKLLHVLGRKNHGKTTLVVELVGELTSRGLRVGTIKHTHHAHELDTPGKDSHRHRLAGAHVVGILSPRMNAVFWAPKSNRKQDGASGGDRYAEFAPYYAECDIVIVEGDTQASGVKIEMWRAVVGDQPMAAADRSISAVVTDDEFAAETLIWPRTDIRAVADGVLMLLGA